MPSERLHRHYCPKATPLLTATQSPAALASPSRASTKPRAVFARLCPRAMRLLLLSTPLSTRWTRTRHPGCPKKPLPDPVQPPDPQPFSPSPRPAVPCPSRHPGPPPAAHLRQPPARPRPSAALRRDRLHRAAPGPGKRAASGAGRGSRGEPGGAADRWMLADGGGRPALTHPSAPAAAAGKEVAALRGRKGPRSAGRDGGGRPASALCAVADLLKMAAPASTGVDLLKMAELAAQCAPPQHGGARLDRHRPPQDGGATPLGTAPFKMAAVASQLSPPQDGGATLQGDAVPQSLFRSRWTAFCHN